MSGLKPGPNPKSTAGMQDPAEGRSLSVVCVTADQREGASTVSLNHPLVGETNGGME